MTEFIKTSLVLTTFLSPCGSLPRTNAEETMKQLMDVQNFHVVVTRQDSLQS